MHHIYIVDQCQWSDCRVDCYSWMGRLQQRMVRPQHHLLVSGHYHKIWQDTGQCCRQSCSSYWNNKIMLTNQMRECMVLNNHVRECMVITNQMRDCMELTNQRSVLLPVITNRALWIPAAEQACLVSENTTVDISTPGRTLSTILTQDNQNQGGFVDCTCPHEYLQQVLSLVQETRVTRLSDTINSLFIVVQSDQSQLSIQSSDPVSTNHSSVFSVSSQVYDPGNSSVFESDACL